MLAFINKSRAGLLIVLLFITSSNALTKICENKVYGDGVLLSENKKYSDCSTNGNIEGLHVAALILAREGSKGIKLKNLATVGGISLLRRALDAINEADVFDSVWVSTDGKLTEEEAIKGGAQVHHRSEESATDVATSIFATQEFLEHHREIDVLALVQCTSPFIKAKYLKEAYQAINNNTRCSFAAKRSFQLRWKEDKSGIIALNFNPSRRPRRQDWKGELIETGMFYFAYRNLMASGSFQDCSCKVVEIPPRDSLEVDTYFDLEIANIMSTVTTESS